jgi:peptidoglycan/LPS O-acetylase OafA/YrhL
LIKDPGKKSAYLPTLDGWRAIAVLAVIFYHDALHAIGPFSTGWLYKYGDTGVDVFFAISGILICSRLLDEEVIFGRIHLKSFYIRRAFRILPPALLYLCVIAILSNLLPVAVTYRELIGSLFFCRNYSSLVVAPGGAGGWYTGHFWSLAVEEQFYFFLPALLVVTPKKYRVGVLGLLALLITVHRAFAVHSRPWQFIRFHTDMRLDALLVPAIFAVLASSASGRKFFKRGLRFWPVLFAATLCILPFGEGTAWRATFIIWAMPCIVLGSVLNSENIFGKFLELSALRYVGRISYSLYLWQQLFFTGHFTPDGRPLGIAQSWPLCLLLAFACAIASHHLLERPLARLGHKLAPSATRGREDLDAGNSQTLLPPSNES